MAKKLFRTSVKPVGVKILLYGLAILITMNLIARFNIIDLTPLQPDLLTLLAIFFVATEIGVMSALRGKKKLGAISMFGAIVVAFAFFALILGWLGISIGFLEQFKGLADLLLLVFVIIEIFR